ncbi:hypothetical protein FOVG_18502 [Fusarium oxysporum f. sp. pisi HDV247]|uniref:BHLH domain-containing protein n=1 Tax=Fusarium oxysporum f. sp. pisi HDV247 TaxID=1080344 RepID=W9NBN1_FUSOX|nr:hypothetical protein FOVG_18502 [Fusarium oxysporum f. sp. pisi HDV247]
MNEESIDSIPVVVEKVSIDRSPGSHGSGSTNGNKDTDKKNDNGWNGCTYVKLPSASRKPKRRRRKPALPEKTLKVRKSHNDVEKEYRTRLKLRFENLLAILQASSVKDKSLSEIYSTGVDHACSRGEVLDAARRHILALEEKNDKLFSKLKRLTGSVALT